MCLCQSIYLSNCSMPLLVRIGQRDCCVEILSDSQPACVSRSRGHSHITCAKKITFFTHPPCCTAYICQSPMRTYKVALPTPTPLYKIVLPYQILHLVSEFQVYMQPVV